MSNSRVQAFGDDAMTVRRAFAQFPSGVAVLAADLDDHKHALVASSFMVGVSLEPCLVAVAVQKTSESWDIVKNAKSVGVSIFGKGQGQLTRKLAGKDRAARFDEVYVEVNDRGAVFIDDAALWLECSLHSVSEAGDHWMALLQVEKLGIGENEPLIWHGARFRELADEDSIVIA